MNSICCVVTEIKLFMLLLLFLLLLLLLLLLMLLLLYMFLCCCYKGKMVGIFYLTISTVVSNLIMVFFTFEIQLDAWDTIPTSGMQKVVLISSDQSKKLTHKILHIIYICILDDFNFTASRWDLTRCICKRNDKKIQEN